uniref:Uncharacterized protein n=2 Tax=Craspedostauros australis TaxID=1486917 RepID=A0A7R9ZMX2_9STRA|mmetsp:Transcript_21017/g.58467  ORF Transcript_21017/g.58467 Transcript_21017/m.58467 type:complete len:105 (+) Transcript_21017:19-333(+)
MMFDSVMRENNLIHALKLYWRYAGSMYPLASMLSHVPYIYADPLIPTTAITNARIGDAPLLRVGDSMWTGNPNWSNGLTMHVATLHKFSKLLNDIDTNDDDDGI